MCYCCNLCNTCGRADEMRKKLGKRLCASCGIEASANDERVCSSCGALLPPPFPELPSERVASERT
ncbi:MAG: hypothetical protein HGA54_09435 [Actinobacteria bacterium]|nr:hypothetical protein [Actinomycetota bacterium]